MVSVSIRGPKNQTSKADRTPKKTSDLATDGHGYTRMRIGGFLALHGEKIGTKLYGYVLGNAILGLRPPEKVLIVGGASWLTD